MGGSPYEYRKDGLRAMPPLAATLERNLATEHSKRIKQKVNYGDRGKAVPFFAEVSAWARAISFSKAWTAGA